MSFFESLLVLLLAAIVLLQVSRRVALPYPAMLAVAGVVVAFVPGAPTIRIDPATALALFIAPVLLDAAYDFPMSAVRQLWRPLTILAVGAVLVTAAVVAWLGWRYAGLPIAAAVVLGAIVAPPDAAAAVAVLGTVSLPRRTIGVLKGESLFNDAVALLLFNGALAVAARGELSGDIGIRLAIAVPGGILLGIALGMVMRWVGGFVSGTLGGSVLQFINVFFVWIIAEHLNLSAVLAVVACAITVARRTDGQGSPRMRVHTLAVWATVVFLLNVLAFLLMGMQARLIVGRMSPERLLHASAFAAMVIAAIVVVRFAIVMAFGVLSRRFAALRGDLPPPTIGQGVVVSWSGMRGLVSLATSFALPAQFPQRDIVVLTAFAVVLATLVIQGLTLSPLIRLLKLDRLEDSNRALAEARQALSRAALDRVGISDVADDLTLRELYQLKVRKAVDPGVAMALKAHRALGLAIVEAQRQALARIRREDGLDTDGYYLLQEEIDWRELTLLPDSQRRIDEI